LAGRYIRSRQADPGRAAEKKPRIQDPGRYIERQEQEPSRTQWQAAAEPSRQIQNPAGSSRKPRHPWQAVQNYICNPRSMAGRQAAGTRQTQQARQVEPRHPEQVERNPGRQWQKPKWVQKRCNGRRQCRYRYGRGSRQVHVPVADPRQKQENGGVRKRCSKMVKRTQAESIYNYRTIRHPERQKTRTHPIYGIYTQEVTQAGSRQNAGRQVAGPRCRRQSKRQTPPRWHAGRRGRHPGRQTQAGRHPGVRRQAGRNPAAGGAETAVHPGRQTHAVTARDPGGTHPGRQAGRPAAVAICRQERQWQAPRHPLQAEAHSCGNLAAAEQCRVKPENGRQEAESRTQAKQNGGKSSKIPGRQKI